MTNFDFLKHNKQFAPFADVAIGAEQILHIDASASIINCRRAMEFAVKWMYSVDRDLDMPYDSTLISLMSHYEFRTLVGKDIYRRMDYIRKTGNIAAHDGKKISLEQAKLCVENLFYFLDFVAHCYSKNYKEREFNPELLELTTEEALSFVTEKTIDLKSLTEENKKLKDELTKRRETAMQTYVPKPIEASEYRKRKLYIDTMLSEAGWDEGENLIDDAHLSEDITADYILYDENRVPLAIIEARYTCTDLSKGRHKAKLCAEIIEKQYGRRPVIFLTNGFEIRIDDNVEPERRIIAIYSQQDLERHFGLS